MNCPYPACGGEVESRGSFGYCKACKLPVFSCLACHAHNRNFSHFCRKCDEPLISHLRDLGNRRMRKDMTSLVNRGDLHQRAILAVSSALQRSALVLSANGNLYSMSPFREDATLFASIGFGFGKCPFVIQDSVPQSQGKTPTNLYGTVVRR